MQKNQLVQIQDEFPCTHFLTYRDKAYPINIELFKFYSQFFSSNQLEAKYEKYIPLLGDESENNIELSEESIQFFVNFVHRKQILLTDENVIFLNYLARKYEVSLLINVTNEYISSNHNNHALQLLILYRNEPKFHPEKYEDIISKNLLDYLDDDRLLSLDISTLHRIVDRYIIEKEKSNENSENDELMQFLFKCLNKFGRTASVLFTHINFTNEKVKYLNQLLFDTEIEFDFHFVGCSFFKSFYKKQNEILKIEMQNRQKHDELMKNVENELNKSRTEQEKQLNEQKSNFEEEKIKLRSEFNQIKSEQIQQFSEQKKKYDEEITNLRSEFNQIKSEQTQQLSEQKKKYDEEITKLRTEFNQMKSELTQQLSEQKKKYDEDITKLRSENEKLSSQVRELCEKQKTNEEIQKGQNNLHKIFGYLSNLSNGGNVIDSGIVGYEAYKVTYNEKRNLFDNSLDTAFKFRKWILFDFKSRQINLSNYYFAVPSEKTGCWYDRPKSWKILGSNDKNKWDLIDLRENVTSLNDFGFSTEFVCNGMICNYYRFIKIEIITSQSNSDEFLLAIIEFFGLIKIS